MRLNTLMLYDKTVKAVGEDGVTDIHNNRPVGSEFAGPNDFQLI